MTGAVIVGGLILLVVVAFGWARISAAWNDRRSIDSYGHALGVLGDVARRSDSSGNVRIVPRESAGGGHVKTEASEAGFPAPRAPRSDRPSEGELAAPRAEERPAALESHARASSQPRLRASVLGQQARPTVPPEQRASILGQGRSVASGQDQPTQFLRPDEVTPRVSIPVPVRPWRFEDDTLEWRQPDQLTGGTFPEADRALTEISSVTDLAAMRKARTRRAGPYEPAPHEPAPYEPALPSDGEAQLVTRAGSRAISLAELRRQVTLRRVATGAAAGVAVLLATVAALQLTGGSHHAAQAQTPKVRSAPKPGRHSSHAATTGLGSTGLGSTGNAGSGSISGEPAPSSAAHKLVPTSTTSTDVSFRVPSRKYLLTFSDTGASDCWVGVESAVGSGIWLWTETLQPGTTTSYKASGPAAVDLGAPENIAVRVNGITAQLPDSALSYDLSFSTKTASASTNTASA